MEKKENFKDDVVRVNVDSISHCISHNRMPRLCGHNIKVWFNLIKDDKGDYIQEASFCVNHDLVLKIQTVVDSPRDIYNVLMEYKKWIIECSIRFNIVPLVSIALDKTFNKSYRKNCEIFGENFGNIKTSLEELI
ncbi:hypothetical protein [Marinifilum flexuosum]|uniref:hypothetical protein n=1 Tax=Marinifilum flexuosum TaxID=1117708 RepID=UPI0024941F4E|nr:hypothetical protein [Marinifilum flexuosum]